MSAHVRSSLSHEERTAQEPRENGVQLVTLSQIEQATRDVRLLRLVPYNNQPFRFMPGQWLDVHVPGLPKAGGFTITSTPQDANPIDNHLNRYIELAIQKSPRNPPAAWLWQAEEAILGSRLLVRVGGGFVWPPPKVDQATIKKVVFVAGGVGINPLISMVSHLHQTNRLPQEVQFIYATRLSESEKHVLFLSRLQNIAQSIRPGQFQLQLYITGGGSPSSLRSRSTAQTSMQQRRISHIDLVDALGTPEDRAGVVCYVCGPPAMTDEFVQVLRHADGMEENRVLCEKWW
ncbi:hypothetical protein MMC16_002287 [Acarospora aff. strigata]|nr:hypothetical protein [Acarospora aff. strigata]